MDPLPPLGALVNNASIFAAMDTGATVSILTIAVIGLIILSALFSMTETAYMSSNRIRLRHMENSGSKGAGKVLKHLGNHSKVLNTVLIGNNIVNITATSLMTVLFATLIKDNQTLSTIVSTVIMTAAVLIFGEILPKSLAKENPEKTAILLYPFLRFFMTLLTPLVWLFALWRKIFKPKKEAVITEDELITIVEEAESGGEIDSHESQLIRSAIEFDDVELYDIMVPRVNVASIEDTATPEQIDAVFTQHQFSRLPVYHGSMDSVIGILHERDFYRMMRDGSFDLLGAIKNTVCLSRNMKISAALRTMQKSKTHMAVIVDEFGGTNGVVTMEDILEELVGEIYDEYDDEEEVLCREDGENTFIISGSQNLDDMFERMGITNTEEFESTTVGGWVTEQMKKIPLAGETFNYRNIEITVTKANPRLVLEIKAVIVPKPEEDEEE